MNKLKKIFKIIEFSLYGIALAISIFFACYFKGEESALYAVIFTAIGLGMLQVVLLLVRVSNHDIIRSLTPYCHVAYLVTSILCYYILKYANHYTEYVLLYWILYISLSIVAIIVAIILNYKLKKNKIN